MDVLHDVTEKKDRTAKRHIKNYIVMNMCSKRLVLNVCSFVIIVFIVQKYLHLNLHLAVCFVIHSAIHFFICKILVCENMKNIV